MAHHNASGRRIENLGAGALPSDAARLSDVGEAAADWDPTLCRYYLVDYANGDDANLGYVDAAPGATIVPTGALKTIERLMQIMPKYGAARRAVVLIRNTDTTNGTTYYKQDGVTEDSLDFTGFLGWRTLVRRGSYDLTNSATDKQLAGCRLALAGPNLDGSFTADAGCTNRTVNVVGGGLPAEPGIIGFRARFTGNVTAGLAGRAYFIQANTAGAITFGSTVTVAAAGDTFFIERPGVLIKAFHEADGGANYTVDQAITTRIYGSYFTWGFGITGSTFGCLTLFAAAYTNYAFMEQLSAAGAQHIIVNNGTVGTEEGGGDISPSMYDDNVALVRCGFGLRFVGLARLMANNLSLDGLAGVGINSNYLVLEGSGAIYNGSNYFQINVYLRGVGAAAEMRGTTSIPIRQVARKITVSGNVVIGYVDFANCIDACVFVDTDAFFGSSYFKDGSLIRIEGCTSALGGNTGYAVDVRNLKNSRVILGRTTANTFTGALGDIILPGNAIFAHTELARNNLRDVAGNDIRSGSSVIESSNVRCLTNAEVGAIAAGGVVRLSAASAVVEAQADSAANATAVCGVALNSPVAGAPIYVATIGLAAVRFAEAAPAAGPAYLSAATEGLATDTSPPLTVAERKLRLGQTVAVLAANWGSVDLRPEIVSVAADGAA